MPSSPIKVGLIGFGNSANTYNLPYMLPCKDLELYAVYQRRGPEDEGLGRWGHVTKREGYEGVKWYQDLDKFLADPAIQLVVITTGHRSHFTLAQSALNAGKHVLSEKPFVTTSVDADTLIALAKSKNLILTVYQNRRWDAEFLTLQKLLKQDALGELTDVVIHYDFASPAWIQGWTDRAYTEGSGEGMMFGLGSHSLDQALQLLGRPSKVTGFIRSLRHDKEGNRIVSEVDDTFMIVLEYDGGNGKTPVMCTVKTSVVNVVSEPLKLHVRGRNGTFIKYGECVQENQNAAGMKSTDESFGVDDEENWGSLVTSQKVEGAQQEWDEKRQKWIGKVKTERGYWRGLYENVAGAILGREELKVKAEESRDGIRVLELARESARKGRSVEWS